MKDGQVRSEWDLELREAGIDDLTKYRIIQYLCQHFGSVAEADFFAVTLGFHSLEQTEVALSELIEQGVLQRERSNDGAAPRYRLTTDDAVRQRVIRLIRGTEKSSQNCELLQRLARRSLARARARAGRNKAKIPVGAALGRSSVPDRAHGYRPADSQQYSAGELAPVGVESSGS